MHTNVNPTAPAVAILAPQICADAPVVERVVWVPIDIIEDGWHVMLEIDSSGQRVRARRRDLSEDMIVAYLKTTPRYIQRGDGDGNGRTHDEKTCRWGDDGVEYTVSCGCVADLGPSVSKQQSLSLMFEILVAALVRLVRAVGAGLPIRIQWGDTIYASETVKP